MPIEKGSMQLISKIKSLEGLADELDLLRSQGAGKTVVQCHGVFDLMHVGHIRHFEEAKAMGDVLVVTLTPDRYVNKGPQRPAFAEDLRAETIAALDCVDYVAVNQWPAAVETVKLLKPDVYVKGPDYRDPDSDITGKIAEEEEAVKSVGGRIAFTDDITFSSSNLINRYLPVYSKEVGEYLSGFSRRYSIEEVNGYLEDTRSLKVLVVGEAIIDEYQYCQTIGKAAKEPILAAQHLSTEKYAGGILAVANHVANFSDNVSMIAMLGADESQEEFVTDKVANSVETMFILKDDSPTIVKRRFLDQYLSQKLFEVYEINDDDLNDDQNRELCDLLGRVLPDFDVVIVADYGHGMMTSDVIDVLCDKSRFLAVNTQSNAGNRGFNTISRYSGADYVTLAHHEIALEERNRRGDVKHLTLSVSKKLNSDRVVVTLGKSGSLCYSKDEGFFEVPAFANQVVDRVGAGDAVLSVTALCASQNVPMEVVGLIGNVVGAQAVATMGHRSSVERVPLMKHIESLLK
jgi:rfaE bifunctional protein kinase chain/domain/rfaE bifunctional protein nucleotidyltransferase chain/domain